MSNPDNQPETFACELVQDLGLEPAINYSVAVAYEIRKQIQMCICQKVQGFCNIYENYVQEKVDQIEALDSDIADEEEIPEEIPASLEIADPKPRNHQ